VTASLSSQLRELGIRQQGDPILRRIATPFVLPAEADEVMRLRETLLTYIQRLKSLHPFRKGMGLAAPQIGISRAMALIQPAANDSADDAPITLLNPVLLASSNDEDDQYEGCLSFFDVRGLVRRPLAVRIQVTDLDGSIQSLDFDRGVARLVLHEIDHLAGKLYIDKLVPGSSLISADDYQGSDSAWQYQR
jgi:peptide deformylase